MPAISFRERFLEALLESATDYAIIATDRTGLVTAWNAGARHVLGWTEREMLGLSADVMFTQADRNAGMPDQERRTTLRDGRSSDERWHERKDGTRFWANGELMPLRDEAGEVQGFVKILRDRTAQRLAAEQQRADAEFMRGVLSASADCIKVLDLDGRLLFMSEGGKRAMEVADFASIHGCPWPDLWAEYGNADAHAAMAAARAGGTGRFQGRARTMAGNLRWWDVQVTPIRDAEGGVARLLAVSRDITATRRAEEALREATSMTALVLEASQDCIVVMDLDAVTRFVSPGGIRGMEISDIASVIGQSWLRVWSGADLDAARAAVAEARAGGIGRFQGFCPTHRGTPKWWDVILSPLPGADGAPERLVSVGRDITERKQAEAALQQAHDTLEQRVAVALAEREEIESTLRQSQKMEAVGQLTGGIAHDFNNLLTGIVGSLEMIQTRIRQNRIDELGRYVASAQGAARRAAALTHRLLAFSRRQTLDPRPISVNRLIADMEEMIRRTVGPSIEVEVVAADDLWVTQCDLNQLENALLNICINARDAMPEGGRLTIETANAVLDDHAARTHDLRPGHYVSLCVSDSGTGIPPEVMARVFEPFFTTKPAGQGTGLGLSMVYGFAQQSGGQIRLYSEPDEGTTVRLYLPRHDGEAESEAPAALADNGPAGAAEGTVLVVDDEPTVRMLILETLADLGYAAREAPDAAAALGILSSGVRIDLLVTDLGLPGGINGRQLAEAARERQPWMKVLFITGYAEQAAARNGQVATGMPLLTKPFAMEALAAKIRQTIES